MKLGRVSQIRRIMTIILYLLSITKTIWYSLNSAIWSVLLVERFLQPGKLVMYGLKMIIVNNFPIKRLPSSMRFAHLPAPKIVPNFVQVLSQNQDSCPIHPVILLKYSQGLSCEQGDELFSQTSSLVTLQRYSSCLPKICFIFLLFFLPVSALRYFQCKKLTYVNWE